MSEFKDTARLWAAGEATEDDVIREAAALVAKGVEGKALVAVAALHPEPSHWGFVDLVEAAMAELGHSLAAPGTREATMAALQVQARRTVEGRMRPLDLATWARSTFDFDGPAEVEGLVMAYYAYNEDVDCTVAEADRQVLEAARRLAQP